MDRIKRAATLSSLICQMRQQGSWCGETHIQKSVFFAQELTDLDLGLEFILYKHGPFSFDLRDELTQMRADGLIEVEPRLPQYGPSLSVSSAGVNLVERYPKTVAESTKAIGWIASRLNSKGVAELERLATALYIIKHEPSISTREERVRKLTAIKSHVSSEEATEAFELVEQMMAEWDLAA